jgi:hypothetical protein
MSTILKPGGSLYMDVYPLGKVRSATMDAFMDIRLHNRRSEEIRGKKGIFCNVQLCEQNTVPAA